MDNLLSIVTFIPALAALILGVFLRGEDDAAKMQCQMAGADLATSVTFLISLFILAQFDPQQHRLPVRGRSVNGSWACNTRWALTASRVLFVMLTTFMMPLVICRKLERWRPGSRNT